MACREETSPRPAPPSTLDEVQKIADSSFRSAADWCCIGNESDWIQFRLSILGALLSPPHLIPRALVQLARPASPATRPSSGYFPVATFPAPWTGPKGCVARRADEVVSWDRSGCRKEWVSPLYKYSKASCHVQHDSAIYCISKMGMGLSLWQHGLVLRVAGKADL